MHPGKFIHTEGLGVPPSNLFWTLLFLRVGTGQTETDTDQFHFRPSASSILNILCLCVRVAYCLQIKVIFYPGALQYALACFEWNFTVVLLIIYINQPPACRMLQKGHPQCPVFFPPAAVTCGIVMWHNL